MDTALSTSIGMSSNLVPKDLKDTNCKKGDVAQQPPVPYAPVKSILPSSSNKSVKVKLPSDNHIKIDMFEGRDNEKYIKHIKPYDCLGKEKGLNAKLHDSTKAAVAALRTMKKLQPVLSSECVW